MSTSDIFILLGVLVTVVLSFCIFAAIKLYRSTFEPKPKTFNELHPNGQHEYRAVYGNWLKCTRCGKMLDKKSLEKGSCILLLLFLLSGCGSPVTRLRVISNSAADSSVMSSVRYILNSANIAAMNGDRYTVARYSIPSSEMEQIAKEIKRIDRKFQTEIQADQFFTTLIVRW